MNYSITGISFLSLMVTLGYLIYRFFQYWKKEKDIVAKQSLYFVGLFGLFVLITTIGGLFFANNSFILEQKIKIGGFIQAFAFAIMAYHIFYLKLPKVSPWLGFFPVLVMGLTVAILTTIFLQFNPFLEASGAINWSLPSGPMAVPLALIRLFLFFILFIPLTIILFSQFKNSEDSRVGKKSLGMGLALLFILIGASFDFLLVGIFHLDPIWRDITFIICSIIFLITLILTLPHSITKTYEPR